MKPICDSPPQRNDAADVSAAEELRYSRHLLLEGWSYAAQEQLSQAHAVVLGVGGLGCMAAQLLVSSGVARVTLVDDDRVELSNLQRQILHDSESVGWDKVASARARLLCINPRVRIDTIAHRLDIDGLLRSVTEASVVLDCTDNLPSRQMINAVCVRAGKALVSAAAQEWQGQLFSYLPQEGSACYHCLYPSDGENYTEAQAQNCGSSGVFAPVVTMMGSLQAAQALRFLAGLPVAASRLHLYDLRTMAHTEMAVAVDAKCKVCRGSVP